MIINKPHLCTRLDIWSPKYSSLHSDGQWAVLLSQRKVHHASSIMIIEFSRAKHLKGGRFAITRDTAQACPLVSNGKIMCYEVPFDKLEHWESSQEVLEAVEGFGW